MSGSPARINPDSRGVLYAALGVTVALALASFLLSYAGLVAVAAWAAVPSWLSWAVPVTIDGAILVYTLAALVFRARGEGARVAWLSLSLFTALSVAANAAHAWDAGQADTRAALGATIAGLAPVAVLLTTHTIARLIIAPPTERTTAVPERDAWAAAAERLWAADALEQDEPAPLSLEERDARIRELAESDLSLRAIAREVGVGKTTVSRVLERGAVAGNDGTTESVASVA
ncbi:excisionase [Microbacterium phage phiMiGM15]